MRSVTVSVKSPRVRAGLVAALFVVTFGLFSVNMWASTHTINLILHTSSKNTNIAIQVACWLGFAASVLLLGFVARKYVPVIMLGGALVLGGIAVSGQPNTSSDSARYNWDGIVQLSGISPYRYVPADAHLQRLEPSWLFQPVMVKDGIFPTCPPYSDLTAGLNTDGTRGAYLCTAINRPQVPTIYPPVAQMLFVGVRALVPAGVTYLPMQLLGLVCLLAVTGLLLLMLHRLKINPVWAAVWAWCPLVLNQGVTNAHIDIAAALFGVLGTMYITQGKRVRGGIFFAAAILIKVLPAILLLPLLRRKPLPILIAAAVTGIVCYSIYLIGGVDVFGYLSGYLNEEGYDDGTRSVLVSLLVPAAYVTPVAGVIFAAVLVWVWRHLLPQPWLAQLVLFGAALLLASPRYPWYALTLVPLIAMTQRWEWFALVFAFVYRQFDAKMSLFQDHLLWALLIILIITAARELWTEKRGLLWNNMEALPVVNSTHTAPAIRKKSHT